MVGDFFTRKPQPIYFDKSFLRKQSSTRTYSGSCFKVDLAVDWRKIVLIFSEFSSFQLYLQLKWARSASFLVALFFNVDFLK